MKTRARKIAPLVAAKPALYRLRKVTHLPENLWGSFQVSKTFIAA